MVCHSCEHVGDLANPVNRTFPDGCKMAFLAIRFINGSISSDTGTWLDIRDEAQRLKRLCGAFPTTLVGGNLVVGGFFKQSERDQGLPSRTQVMVLGLP